MLSLAGKTISHYRIDRELGRGGMATVYLAEDTKHRRRVAVKVMNPDIAAAIGQERFLREIQIAATLNHPHVLALFDSGSDQGQLFYVTPYIAGESLRARLDREKQLPLEEALRLAREIASALGYAHQQGLVHRDIKPENVLLADGIALVADFGIAKAMVAPGGEGATQATVTGEGAVLGTPRYMAPEQAGGGDVDGRADLYALACVLFEMLAGRPPFLGATSEAILVQRFTQPPPRLSAVCQGMPSWIDAALYRAMSREPADRFPTVSRFAEALGHRSGRQEDAREKSIAVLPFTNTGGASEDDYFSDGITEEIMNALSQLEGLRVAARTSAFAFKGKHEDLRVVGEKLNVKTVLEGSVRKAGNRLRITAQLVDVAEGYQLWSERYDRDLTDVFAIQDEIATSIAAKLKIMLSGEHEKAARRGTTNLDAYELFLKGRALQWKRGQRVVQAAECFEKAVALDPRYAEALGWMSDSYRLMGLFGYRPSGEAMPRAKELAERAIALDPEQDEAYATLADVALTYEYDATSAFRHWEHALALNPAHVRSRCEYAFWGLCCARESYEEAVREVRRATQGDPLNSYAAAMAALVLSCARRFPEAQAEARRAVDLDPENFTAYWVLMQTSSWVGDHEGAMAVARSALLLSARGPWVLAALGCAHGRAGRTEAAEAIYAEIQARARSEYVQKATIALAAIGAGRLDEAMTLAEQAVDEHDAVIVQAASHAFWGPLRKHPRFSALRRRLGLS